MDELVWGAAWLYRATKLKKYWDFALNNLNETLSPKGVNDTRKYALDYGWDAKQGGIVILLSQFVMKDFNSGSPFVSTLVDILVCSKLPDSPTKSVTFTPENLQFTTSSSLLLLIYGQYLQNFKRQVHCGYLVADASKFIQVAKGQADYILGKNPLGMSFMIGYGDQFPQRIHHRASSLPSIKVHPKLIKCKDGSPFYLTKNPNQNILTGALPGGPVNSDNFSDDRGNVQESEPMTYLNSFFVGVLAYFTGHPN
ncbi:hypothetical protein SLA2020_154760 [Shorea laevis]